MRERIPSMRRRAVGDFFKASALALAPSLAACGVMFGATDPEIACGPTSCTSNADCPPVGCICNDGQARNFSLCVPDKSCCAALEETCESGCQPFSGWSGSTAGTGGTGGSGGSAGSAGSFGSGGASASGGSFGSGGTGGGQPIVGDSCSPSGEVTCGCEAASDLSCNSVLVCESSSWLRVDDCGPSIECFTRSTRTTANCGTTDLYLPYALTGAACLMNETFACSLDRSVTLRCNAGFWEVSRACGSQTCSAIPGGTQTCTDPTSFCIGCL